MKCVYCNSETNITISDIIPKALTGAKLTRHFVCEKHNKFTNDNYEKQMINLLAPYRNLIGLKERDGGPVRFHCDLNIGTLTLKNVLIKDNASVLNTDRIIANTDSTGKKFLVGDRDKLLNIKGATETNVETIETNTFSVILKNDLRELFITTQTLHAVAKIGYESHCYLNNINEFISDKYNNIVSYILNAEDKNSPVEIVVDPFLLKIFNANSRTGTNILFEYNDFDGYTYVIFGLWNVILYKIKICKSDIRNTNLINSTNVHFYHVDGTKSNTFIMLIGKSHIISETPDKGLSLLCSGIKTKLSEVGQRDLSVQYVYKNIEKILKDIPKYKSNKITILQLLDFGHKDKIIPVFLIEQLFDKKDYYNDKQTFTEIMVSILKCGEKYGLTDEKVEEILERYLSLDKEGAFASMLENAINYFKKRFISNK